MFHRVLNPNKIGDKCQLLVRNLGHMSVAP